MADLDYRGYWDGGFTWTAYVADEVQINRALWEGVARGVRLPAWALERAAAVGGSWKLLVISEDWCGDASNTVPV
ncbi:MAG TPA: thioredoxin family protein, partial [Longimicrobiaceae bacterium]|nr:thioredoxin family protein [Longimicrobiaceae bacterium]